MCSIFKYKNCVGRNFDYEVSYDEELRVIEPKQAGNQYKIIGMCAGVVKDYPLLYDPFTGMKCSQGYGCMNCPLCQALSPGRNGDSKPAHTPFEKL